MENEFINVCDNCHGEFNYKLDCGYCNKCAKVLYNELNEDTKEKRAIRKHGHIELCNITQSPNCINCGDKFELRQVQITGDIWVYHYCKECQFKFSE